MTTTKNSDIQQQQPTTIKIWSTKTKLIESSKKNVRLRSKYQNNNKNFWQFLWDDFFAFKQNFLFSFLRTVENVENCLTSLLEKFFATRFENKKNRFLETTTVKAKSIKSCLKCVSFYNFHIPYAYSSHFHHIFLYLTKNYLS